jgi:branched-chain amino acid transport system substrate-binding protein
MHRSSSWWVAAAVATGLVAAGCSSDAATPASTLAPTSTTTPRQDDGVLKIGVLVPQGSANAGIGESISRAVNLAVERINVAGGYHGAPVVLIPQDESVSGGGVDPAIRRLLEANVDAIVGPASSLNALSGLREIVDAGVVSCSPTASSALLDDFPDNGLFFRTIPSDSLEAFGIAEAVDRTGASEATIAYLDDDYGQMFADNVQTSLTTKGIKTTAVFAYSPNNQSITTAAEQIGDVSTGVIVVIGDASSGPVMIDAIDTASGKLPLFVVNDALRRPTAASQPFPGALATRVTGVSPIAYSTNPQFVAALTNEPDSPNPYAGNAYDCVNLIALAALAADSTQPTAIASMIPFVSVSGTPCVSFVACQTGIEAGSNVNYEGEGGSDTMDAKGELTSATFELFGFDQTGRDVPKGFIVVRP